MSRIVDWSDRGTCVLFGDGAGAVVLEPAPPGEPGAVESFLLRSDGSQAGLLYAPGPASARLDGVAPPAHIVMDGPGVFRQAITAMSEVASEALSRAGRTIDDIALCIPHQANLRILTATARNLGLPEERLYVNLDRYRQHLQRHDPDRAHRGRGRGAAHAGRPPPDRRLRRRALLGARW